MFFRKAIAVSFRKPENLLSLSAVSNKILINCAHKGLSTALIEVNPGYEILVISARRGCRFSWHLFHLFFLARPVSKDGKFLRTWLPKYVKIGCFVKSGRFPVQFLCF